MNLKGFFVNIVCNKVRKWHANIPNTGVCSLMVHLALLGKHEIVGGFLFVSVVIEPVISLEGWLESFSFYLFF